MEFREILLIAVRSFRSNILRTLLTMLGIIIGIFAITLILIISQSATSAITAKFSSLGTKLVHVPRGPYDLLSTDDTIAIIEQVGGIAAYSEEVNRSETVTANGKNSIATVEGVSSTHADIFFLNLEKGNFFTTDENASYASVVVLGSQIAAGLFSDENPVGQYIQVKGKFFHIIGVLSPKSSTVTGATPDSSVYIPISTMTSVVTGSKHIDTIDIIAERQEDVSTIALEIKQLLLDRYSVTDPVVIEDFTVFTSRDLIASVESITRLISAVLAGIAGISLVVGGIGIMNIMLVTVTERTKEIGLLKAIGAKRRDILMQFLVEAIVLTVLGGIIGITLGIIAGYIASLMLAVAFIPPLLPIFAAGIVSILVGLIFGLYPAKRAAEMSPIDALRYE